MSYLDAFPDYDDQLPELEGFSDCSYRNDVCPSLCDCKEDEDPENCIHIFCDYKNPKRRELGEDSPRFSVCQGYSTGNYVFYSEDWEEVKKFIRGYK